MCKVSGWEWPDTNKTIQINFQGYCWGPKSGYIIISTNQKKVEENGNFLRIGNIVNYGFIAWLKTKQQCSYSYEMEAFIALNDESVTAVVELWKQYNLIYKIPAQKSQFLLIWNWFFFQLTFRQAKTNKRFFWNFKVLDSLIYFTSEVEKTCWYNITKIFFFLPRNFFFCQSVKFSTKYILLFFKFYFPLTRNILLMASTLVFSHTKKMQNLLNWFNWERNSSFTTNVHFFQVIFTPFYY